MSIRRQHEQQKESNRASLKYFSHFENHRAQLTELIVNSASAGLGRICILGAGNCFDMDLAQLVKVFSEVHLVDLDRLAIANARARLPKSLAQKVFLHGTVDLCNTQKEMKAWRAMETSPEALITFPDRAIQKVLRELPGPFDCVVSACLISQIMLSNRLVLGDGHPLLEAVMVTLLVTHLRLMAQLTGNGGRSLWVSDVSSDEIASLDDFDPKDNGLPYLTQRIHQANVFTYVEPSLLCEVALQDPDFSKRCELRAPLKSWLWQNGPNNRFLVYACEILPLASKSS